MAELRDAGALGFTDDGKPVVSAGILRKALQYQRLCGGVVALHEEDPTLSGDGVMHEGAVSARLGLAGIPSIAESTMVARDGALALYEDARVHFQHLSAWSRSQALAAAKQAGARVSGEVSPHHLTLTDDLVRTLDSRFKMNPPLRAEPDRRALVEGLRSGVIDCVATDHAPHASTRRRSRSSRRRWGRPAWRPRSRRCTPSWSLPVSCGLATVVERMTAGGGALRSARPRVAVGEPANLCLVDLEARFEVGEDGYASRSANCCFHGRIPARPGAADARRRRRRLPRPMLLARASPPRRNGPPSRPIA